MQTASLGVFGGTFDPIHYGHLRAMQEVYENFSLSKMVVVPCKIPALKHNPLANPEHRLAMLKLALKELDWAQIDTKELDRNTPSYMVETLTLLHDENPKTKLHLILGADAFIDFTAWHQWERILNLANIIVLKRPGFAIDIDKVLPDCILPDGKIAVQTMTQLAISSTHIRELLAKGKNPRFLLPENVLHYIYQHHLY